jgi:hypothetical protein
VLSGFLVSAALTFVSGSFFEASAQVDINIQSRTQPYTPSLVPSISDVQQITDNTGACLSDSVFVLILFRGAGLKLGQLPPGVRDDSPDPKKNSLVTYLGKNPQVASKLLADFFESHPDQSVIKEAVRRYYSPPPHKVVTKSPDGRTANLKFVQPPAPTPFCKSSTITKLSIPFNPTSESNVLKSSLNDSPGTSLGFGGSLQVFAPGLRKFDVIGLSAQDQSVRYNSQFLSKSFDAVTTQAAYQYYLGATGFKSNGEPSGPIESNTKPQDIPPQNMMMIQSVAFGFQNQTVYTPSFRSESVNLFTPQVTYNLQNLPLGGKPCDVAIPDPRKEGFCYYADFSFTVGQTLSDVASQQNSNFSVSVTPGWRIPNTDWKLTLPLMATGRIYNDVPSGRDDMLLQIGPALTYAPPPFFDGAGVGYSALFSVSAMYNQNYSTVSTAAWRGYIFMPTLAIAFQPPPKVQ